MPPSLALRLCLQIHLGNRGLDQSEHRVQVDGHGPPPLRLGHLRDGRILGWPYPVIGHQYVQTTKGGHGSRHQRAPILGAAQILLYRYAAACPAALGHQRFGPLPRLAVAERNPRSRFTE